MAKVKDALLPIEWDGWDTIDTMAIQLYNVEFLADWGMVKAGTKVNSLFLCMDKGIVAFYDADGNQTDKFDVKLFPVQKSL